MPYIYQLEVRVHDAHRHEVATSTPRCDGGKASACIFWWLGGVAKHDCASNVSLRCHFHVRAGLGLLFLFFSHDEMQLFLRSMASVTSCHNPVSAWSTDLRARRASGKPLPTVQPLPRGLDKGELTQTIRSIRSGGGLPTTLPILSNVSPTLRRCRAAIG